MCDNYTLSVIRSKFGEPICRYSRYKAVMTDFDLYSHLSSIRCEDGLFKPSTIIHT